MLREAGRLEMDAWEGAQKILSYSLKHHKPVCPRTQEGTSYTQPIAAESILLKHITRAAVCSRQLAGQNLAKHLSISTT